MLTLNNQEYSTLCLNYCVEWILLCFWDRQVNALIHYWRRLKGGGAYARSQGAGKPFLLPMEIQFLVAVRFLLSWFESNYFVIFVPPLRESPDCNHRWKMWVKLFVMLRLRQVMLLKIIVVLGSRIYNCEWEFVFLNWVSPCRESLRCKGQL